MGGDVMGIPRIDWSASFSVPIEIDPTALVFSKALPKLPSPATTFKWVHKSAEAGKGK